MLSSVALGVLLTVKLGRRLGLRLMYCIAALPGVVLLQVRACVRAQQRVPQPVWLWRGTRAPLTCLSAQHMQAPCSPSWPDLHACCL